MEYSSRLLKINTQHFGFHFHPKCQALGISHLGFTDDILLLYRCDMVSVSIILHRLNVFGETSGLVINAAKSFIFFASVSWDIKHVILSLSVHRRKFSLQVSRCPPQPSQASHQPILPSHSQVRIGYSELDGKTSLLCWSAGVN